MYYPHVIGKTWVVNRTVIRFLQNYCYEHPRAWGEQLQHMQCIKSPFETYFGYLPKTPMEFSFGKDAVDGHHDADKALRFIQRIHQWKMRDQ